MGEPADQTPNPSPTANNVADIQSSGRKVPRRRLIQSTLFPLKPHDKKSENSAKVEVIEVEKINVDVDDNDGDVVECCGNQSGKKKRGRKPKSISTPQKRRSKKIAGNGNDGSIVAIDGIESPDEGSPQLQKEKQRTPTRNGRTNCNKRTPVTKTPPRPVADHAVSQSVPDLWQEARRTAEENSRIFAGKQIHPFFSSWKTGKKEQEMGEVEYYGCLAKTKEKYAEPGPIHVLDDSNDDLDPIDWSNWTFTDGPFSQTTCKQEREIFSFKDTVCLSNFSPASNLNPCGASLTLKNISSSQYPAYEHTTVLPTFVSSMMADKEVMQFDQLQNIHKELGTTQLHCIGGGDDGLNSELNQNNLQQERMISYYLNRFKTPENCLWTNKYQPEKASEVCGNSEAVNFINDWLRLWHAADLHFSKKLCNPDKFIVEDDEYDSSGSDSGMGTVNEASDLKNVLLVSGPVGSGKSAAIYACAKEQGFQVLEVNASDWRNGALLKQRFGEAVGLHWLKRSQETPLGSQSELNSQSSPALLSNGAHTFDLNNPAIEVISLSEEEEGSVGGVGIQCHNDGRLSYDPGEIKTLILFEDVDATLCEDRGFISTIQQLADTAKRPMILTSNSDDPDLPNNLDREEICFTMPSLKELIHHISLVCAAEKAYVQPHLIERCIEFCKRDIRKTLMHLQFWCQSKRLVKDTKMTSISCPLTFSLEAAHCTLPKLIPWALPSALSEFVEAEISSSLCSEQDDHCLLDVTEDKNMLNVVDCDKGEAAIKAKKDASLSGNCFLHVDNDNISVRSTCELPNCPDSPISFSRRCNVRRKLDTVFSDSEDELSGREKPPVLNDISSDLDNNAVPAVESAFPISFPVLEGTSNGFGDHLLLFGARKLDETKHQPSETIDAHINLLAIKNSCLEADNSEVKHQFDMNSGCPEEPSDLMSLLRKGISKTGQARMKVNGNQYLGMSCVQQNISAMDTPRNHLTDQLIHFQEAKVTETDSQNAVGQCLNNFNDHMKQCGKTNTSAAGNLFSEIRPADGVSCEIGSPGYLSSDSLIHCRDFNKTEFQDMLLEVGNVNSKEKELAEDSLNPVFYQSQCCKANIEHIWCKQPDTTRLNHFSSSAVDGSLTPAGDQLICSSEAEGKEVWHRYAEAEAQSHSGYLGNPLSQPTDQRLGTAKMENTPVQGCGSADINQMCCRLVDDSLNQNEDTKIKSILLRSPKTSKAGSICPADTNPLSSSGDEVPLVTEAKVEEQQHQYSEVTGGTGAHQVDQCLSVDVSCVPESIYVPETEISDGTDFPVGTDLVDIISPVTNADINPSIIRQEAAENVRLDGCIVTNVSGEEMGDSQSENQHLEASTSGCQVMDECSRMDFCPKFRRLKSSLEAKNLVQERWNGLHLMDLKPYSISENENAQQVLDLVHGVSNLIAEGDLLLPDSQYFLSDSCDKDTFLSEETLAFGWLDQQVQMASTISELGYWLYANDSDTLQLKMGTNCRSQLSWEMLTSSNNSMTLGKLLRLNRSRSEASSGDGSSNLTPPIVDTSFGRERKTRLQNIVQSVAPLRSYLALRGNLHEYLSSLSHISRSEASRLSGDAEKKKRRRVRATKNYLSSGGLDLSPDDISLLIEYHSYGKSSFKSTL